MTLLSSCAGNATMTDHRMETVEHRIGATGRLTLEIIDGAVRVRGGDGDVARVTVHMPDGASESTLKVDRGPDELRVDVRDAIGASPRKGLRRGDRPLVDLDVEMPRSGRLAVSGVSADLHVTGVLGDQDHRTISGDVEVVDVEGSLTVHAVSGDVRVSGGTYALEGVTTSGDIQIRAQRLEHTRLRSVSGDLDLAAAFASETNHRVETVSGDLRIAPTGGLTVVARGFSTRIVSEIEHRSEWQPGRRTVIVGDGRAHLDFRSMSGDVSLVDASSADAHAAGTHSADTHSADTQPSDQKSVPPVPRYRLSILRDLERGAITVNEATRLLEESDDD